MRGTVEKTMHTGIGFLDRYRERMAREAGMRKSRAGGDPQFAYFRRKVLEHLEALEGKENVGKALLAAGDLLKGGFPVGTIRVWKGKRYIKIAPGKWRPKYDSQTRGANLSVAAIKRKADRCRTSQELLQLVLEHKSRFSDKNGYPLPFVKELSDYVSGLNDRLEAGSASGGKTEDGKGKPRPIGKGDFGNIYDCFKHKPKEAIDFLLKNKGGEAIGALSHKEIGDIDLVYGEAGSSHSDGYGLAKLEKFHPEVLDKLQNIIDDMKVAKKTANRVQLESETHKASVRLTWNGKSKTWLLTAFEKSSDVSGSRTGIAGTDGSRKNDTATLANTAVSTIPQSTGSVKEKAKKPSYSEKDREAMQSLRNLLKGRTESDKKRVLMEIGGRGGTKGRIARMILKEDYGEERKQDFSLEAVRRREVLKRVRRESKEGARKYEIFGKRITDKNGTSLTGKKAIETLLELKYGYVENAFVKDGIGGIDVVYGKVTDAKKHKGYGLAHIIDKHPEITPAIIEQIISKGEVSKTYNGFNIKYKNYVIGVNKGFKADGKLITNNNWIVTTFEKKEEREDSAIAHAENLTSETVSPQNSPSTSSIPQSDGSVKESEEEKHRNRSEAMRGNQNARKGALKVLNKQETHNFIEKHKNSKENERVSLGSISGEAKNRIKDKTGLGVERVILDSDSIRHTFNNPNHNLEPNDLDDMKDVIETSTDISLSSDKNAVGNPVIVFKKQEPNGVILCEEYRAKKKELELQTAYRVKKNRQPHGAEKQLPANVRNATAPRDKILQFDDSVKAEKTYTGKEIRNTDSADDQLEAVRNKYCGSLSGYPLTQAAREAGIPEKVYHSLVLFLSEGYAKTALSDIKNGFEPAFNPAAIKKRIVGTIDHSISCVAAKDRNLLSLLQNTANKTTRKVFETISGLKVGTTRAEARGAWEKWVGKDAADALKREEKAAKEAEKASAEAEKRAKREKLEGENREHKGFLDGMSPANRERAKTVLAKEYNFGGGYGRKTWKGLAEEIIGRGGNPHKSSEREYRLKYKGDDGSWYSFKCPKIVCDYAEHIAKTGVKESLSGSILKAGYPVGTVRVWKGKRYIKTAPGKWKPQSAGKPEKKAKGELTEKEKENLSRIDSVLSKNIELLPEKIAFTRENFARLFKDGIDSPIEYIKVGEHQFEKLESKGRQGLLAPMADVLKDPALIIKTGDNAKLYAKTYQGESGEKTVVSVVVDKNGMQVSVSTHIERNKQLAKKMDAILYERTASAHGETPHGVLKPQPDSSISQSGKSVKKSWWCWFDKDGQLWFRKSVLETFVREAGRK